MKFWGHDNPLTQAWDTKVRKYFDLVEAFTGIHHHDTRITTKEDMNALRKEFSERFGSEGDQIAGALAASKDYNGGEEPGNPEEYFPGMEYSIPLIFYFAKRAMDKETPAHAYDVFVNDIMSYAERKEYDINRIPTKWFVEELSEPYLEQIKEVEAKLEAEAETDADAELDHDEDKVIQMAHMDDDDDQRHDDQAMGL